MKYADSETKLALYPEAPVEPNVSRWPRLWTLIAAAAGLPNLAPQMPERQGASRRCTAKTGG